MEAISTVDMGFGSRAAGADGSLAEACRAGDSSELSRHSKSLPGLVSASRLNGLKLALGKFGLLRGEVMDATRLESYSRAIAEEFAEDADVLAVLGRLVRSRRAEYEAKIPELGELLALIRDHRKERSRQAREAQERNAHQRYLDDVKAHPERYLSVKALLMEYRASQQGACERKPPAEAMQNQAPGQSFSAVM